MAIAELGKEPARVFEVDPVVAQLKKLVGGGLIGSKVSGTFKDPGYYPESGPITNPDNLDVLGALVYGMDPNSYAILTGKIRKSDLYPTPVPATERPKDLRRIWGGLQRIFTSNRFLSIYSAGSAI